MIRACAALLTAGALGIVSMPVAWACTCSPLSVGAAKRSADVVFAARVEEVTLVDKADEHEPRIIVRFKVARVWKGPVGATFSMHTNYEFSSCGGFFRDALETGTALLVYGFGRPASLWKGNNLGGAPNAISLTVMDERKSPPLRRDLMDTLPDAQVVYTTNICSRTKPIEHAAADFRKLGKARELAALEVVPDPGIDVDKPPPTNGLPRWECGQFHDPVRWTRLKEPPDGHEQLIARLESSAKYPPIAVPRPTQYKDYWLRSPDGRYGLCRIPTDRGSACGQATVEFREELPGTGNLTMENLSVNTYCEQ